MNFQNADYDGQRGVQCGYGEFIPSSDRTLVQGTAQRVCDAINSVRGGHYEARQSVYVGRPDPTFYPTSGAAPDYCSSRHFVDCTRRKVYGFTLEFNDRLGDAWTRFHPPWPEMEQIVEEIDAGLVEFCSAAAPRWIPPWIVAWRRVWPWEIWDPMARRLDAVIRPVLTSILGEPGRPR
jgi:hypothetical protein